MKPLRIRAHHGLCFLFFKGLGYNAAFVDNMQAVWQVLQENPMVTLTTQCDCVCVACPNCGQGGCVGFREVQTLDQRVLALCGLTAETPIYWDDLRNRVLEAIVFAGKRQEICGACQWSAICAAQEQAFTQEEGADTTRFPNESTFIENGSMR